MSAKTLRLQDLEVQYANIRKVDPDRERCSVRSCNNPRDSTEGIGEDTCCAYHRLLFDFWFYEIAPIRGHDVPTMTQRGRRTAFAYFLRRTGKQDLDAIVLRMMAEPINWVC